MRQNTHDLIPISNQLGHPDIFLTMTYNPKCPKITQALFHGKMPQDRLDICARVFRAKLRALIAFIVEVHDPDPRQMCFTHVQLSVALVHLTHSGSLSICTTARI